MGYDVRLIIDPASPLRELAVSSGMEVCQVKLPVGNGFFKARRLQQFFADWKPDVLLAVRPYDVSTVSWYQTLAPRVRTVFVQHTQKLVEGTGWLEARAWRGFNAWVVPLAQHRSVPVDLFGYPAERVCVIPPGLDLLPYQDTRLTREAARQQLDLPLDATLIGMVAKLDPPRQQQLVLEAFLHLTQQPALADRNLGVLFVGEPGRNNNPDYEARLKVFLQRHGLIQRVFFRRSQQVPAVVYKALDVYVHTAPDIFGMPLYEAMLSEVPVVAVRAAGPGEIVSPDQTGLLCSPGSVTEFADALYHLLVDPERVHRLTQQARTHAGQTIAWPAVLETWKHLIDRLAGA
jgi:glycosyltransferase involved in cell wall biosynthesis